MLDPNSNSVLCASLVALHVDEASQGLGAIFARLVRRLPATNHISAKQAA